MSTRPWNYFSASVKLSKMSGWIKANIDQIGYYQVNYEKDNWEALYNQHEGRLNN